MTTATVRSTDDRSERGQSLVEFSLAFLVVVTMLMMILDLGRGVYFYTVITAAASEGARFGITDPSDVAGITAATQARAVGVDLAQMTINVVYPDSDHVQVEVQYVFIPISPLVSTAIPGGTINLSSVARMRIF